MSQFLSQSVPLNFSPDSADGGAPGGGRVAPVDVVVGHDPQNVHGGTPTRVLSIPQGCLHRFDCVVCVPCFVRWDTLGRDGRNRRLDSQWAIWQRDPRDEGLGSQNWTYLAYVVSGHA